MNILTEFKTLIKSLLSWIYVLVGLTLFFFLFGWREVALLGGNLILPLPTSDSFSVGILKALQNDLLPAGVQLIATNPMSAFLAQMTVAFAAGFLMSFPWLIFKIAGYFSPALYANEKKAVAKIFLPAFILFIIGCFFSYLFLIPPTFRILYSFTANIGALSYFSITEFVQTVFSLTIMAGTLFLLPVFMVLLSRFGIIKSDFWGKNWRYAILCFLVFSAIITPDGTGITMVLFCLPLSSLYGLGLVFSRKSYKIRGQELKVTTRP